MPKMPRRFASILDECLAALSRGESVEACLGRHPKHAEQLRIYLPLARKLSQTPHQRPRAAAQVAGWNQFQAKAEDMRLGRRPVIIFGFGWMRPMAIAAALVLAFLGVAGGTAYASQDALPDSPLYRVKLFSEDARAWITLDDSDRAELLLDQSNERTEEIMALLRDGKSIPGSVLSAMRERNARAVRILEDRPEELALLTRAREQSKEQEDLLLVLWGDLEESAQDDYAKAVATLHNAQLRTAGTPGAVTPDDVQAGVTRISGTAEPAGEGRWALGGVELSLDERTRGDARVEPGQQVSVIAARTADGRLLALDVTAASTQRSEPHYFVSGAVEEVDEDEVVVGGQRIAITQQTLLKLKLELGRQVEVAVEDVDGQAIASTVEATDDDPARPNRALLAYEGVIEEEITTGGVNNDWVIGGRRFTVTPDTEIDASDGVLAAGTRARVEAMVDGDSPVARRVVVLASEAEDDVVQVEGVLEASDETSWTVSGMEVPAPPDSELPAVGSMVSLEIRRTEDDVGRGKVIGAFEAGRSGLVRVRGHVDAIGEDGTWRVGLTPVQVTEDTLIIGEAHEGSRVFIWGSRDDEGNLEAAHVKILDRKKEKPGSESESESESQSEAEGEPEPEELE